MKYNLFYFQSTGLSGKEKKKGIYVIGKGYLRSMSTEIFFQGMKLGKGCLSSFRAAGAPNKATLAPYFKYRNPVFRAFPPTFGFQQEPHMA